MLKKCAVGAMLLSLLVAVSAPVFAQAAGPFADVPVDHWAYNAIEQLAQAGLIEGYPDGTFKGQKALTRYEFAVAIARLLDYAQRTFTSGGGTGPAGPQGPAGPAGPPGPQGPAGGLTPEQQALLDRLQREFANELAQLRADVEDLTRRVEALEAVPPVEMPKVKVGGDIRWRFGLYGNTLRFNSGDTSGYPPSVVTVDGVPVGVTGLIPIGENVAVIPDSIKDSFKANDFSTMRTRVILDGDLSDNLAVHATLVAQPRNNFTDTFFNYTDPAGNIVSPNAVYANGIMDLVNVDEAYAVGKTDFLLPIKWTVGKQYWGWGQGLLVDNDLQAIKSALAQMDFGSVKVDLLAGALDRELFQAQTTGINALPGEETSGQDNYLAGRLTFNIGQFDLGGTWLQNGFGDEQGWAVDLSTNIFGRRIFGEWARLEKTSNGTDLGDLADEQNDAIVAGIDLFDTSSFRLTGKWGMVEPNYAFGLQGGGFVPVDPRVISGVVGVNLPLSLLHPYAEWSPDYINWVDRPLFLDPTNVARGWEVGFTWKTLFGGTMPLSVRWYDGDAYNPAFLTALATGASTAGIDKWRSADGVLVVSITKPINENVDFTLLYGRREVENVMRAVPGVLHDDLQVVRGEVAVRF